MAEFRVLHWRDGKMAIQKDKTIHCNYNLPQILRDKIEQKKEIIEFTAAVYAQYGKIMSELAWE